MLRYFDEKLQKGIDFVELFLSDDKSVKKIALELIATSEKKQIRDRYSAEILYYLIRAHYANCSSGKTLIRDRLVPDNIREEMFELQLLQKYSYDEKDEVVEIGYLLISQIGYDIIEEVLGGILKSCVYPQGGG